MPNTLLDALKVFAGRDTFPTPCDLASYIEEHGLSAGVAPDDGDWGNVYQIQVMWGKVRQWICVFSSGGSYDLWLSYTPRGIPAAFLHYKDDSWFSASGDNPMYREHTPSWDRGWEELIREAELLEA